MVRVSFSSLHRLTRLQALVLWAVMLSAGCSDSAKTAEPARREAPNAPGTTDLVAPPPSRANDAGHWASADALGAADAGRSAARVGESPRNDHASAPHSAAATGAPKAAIVLADIDMPTEPIDAVRHLLSQPQEVGERHCIQIRSFAERAEASQMATRIQREQGLPTWIFAADLGTRGTWFRLCIGAETTERAARRKAETWTSKQGELRHYMDEVVKGQARYLIKKRPAPAKHEPTRAQAETMLRASASAERPMAFLHDADGVQHIAMTAPKMPSTPDDSEVVVITPTGDILPVTGVPESPCAACAQVYTAPDVQRRILEVGAVDGGSGQVVLINESSGREEERTEILSILRVDGGELRRFASFLLSNRGPELRVLGEAELVQADLDEAMELGVVRYELSIVDKRLCALRVSSEILDFADRTNPKLDENHAAKLASSRAPADAESALRLVRSYDALGDADTASRVCAAYLANGRSPKVARHCLQRLQELGQKSALSATKAAGFLAEASSLYRATVANALYRHATTLNQDKRLDVRADSCRDNPLVDDVQGKRDEHLVRLAEIKMGDRVNLADLPDAVFVTGLRDFGPGTPFGDLVQNWLERIQDVLPARYAAIQAALLPANFAGLDRSSHQVVPQTSEPSQQLNEPPQARDERAAGVSDGAAP